jgi:predicted membrane channel-forming protein YqfA (hemolysin III family)
VTIAFSFAIVGAVRSMDMRRDERPLEAGVYVAIGLIGLTVTLAALVYGIIIMTSKG